MKKIFFPFLLVLSLSIALASCSKDGDTGPAGATGPAGPAGPTGATGSPNVIYSDWFSPTSWTNSLSPNAYFDKAAPAITQEILDKGAIMAYTKLTGGGTSVRVLPAIIANTTFWNFYSTGVGNLRFTCSTTDGANVSPSIQNLFRYVIIPGGVSSGKMSVAMSTAAMEELKKKTYEEILKLYNIPADGTNSN